MIDHSPDFTEAHGPETPDFDPVPLRFRHDGWTPARQWNFIQVLADTGSVDQAAQSVMMSQSSAYRLRRHPDAGDFRRAWDAALDLTWSQLSQLAIERIRYGEIKTIHHKDGQKTTITSLCSDRLLITAMKIDDARRARAEARAEARTDAGAAAAPAAAAAAAAAASIAASIAASPAAAIAIAIADDAACTAFHRLAAGLTDKPGWEGPRRADPGDVPILPSAPRHLAPASLTLATRAAKARWRAGTTAGGRGTARGYTGETTELR